MPLADTYRPQSFDDMVGQQPLVGPHGVLRHLADTKTAQSIIMYGPPGLGKTTSARILAQAFGKQLFELNATTASTSDIKKIAEGAPDEGCVLYLDEIQYFNKKQQQSLLSFVESGVITLLASTTENPYHGIYDALLSRCMVLEFKKPSAEEVATRVLKAASDPQTPIYGLSNQVCHYVSKIASGDVRRALNTSEMVCSLSDDPKNVTIDDVKRILPTAIMAGFDKDGESHYQYVSALQKSIRGSDPDAAVFWLAKMLEGGDIISPIRRLPAICCEDIGLAYPDAIVHTMACCQAAESLGLPEAYKPLTEAVILLALAPKSASNEPAWMAARDDIKNGLGATTPLHIRSEHAPGYVWPQDRPYHWFPQQYLPDDLKARRYYTPGDNSFEQQAYGYWQDVKNKWHD